MNALEQFSLELSGRNIYPVIFEVRNNLTTFKYIQEFEQRFFYISSVLASSSYSSSLMELRTTRFFGQ